jgi:hypothetical protein
MTRDIEFTDRELKLIDEALEQRELREDLVKLADQHFARQWEIERLESLMQADVDAYHREGGSDRLMALLDEED